MTIIFNFPDDLLEAANLKPGDQIEWISTDDNNYLLRKVINNNT
jgi:bifunctional DNA-binding transcriptional regulator/antitoxin component of YhaV-PrlF toxin-antitoxin module